ncbi:hypothetical protein BpHYR1_014143 [Brachionus plicatilis]|uniref:Uncharacterized protein n=1 Tax=Brachionus plicatilis TaxID=10195 RepID=A0A3M7PYV2_BRAPC|nr:hypothetical protein BpHYR1_014143 [Brachionus plicatilis]
MTSTHSPSDEIQQVRQEHLRPMEEDEFRSELAFVHTEKDLGVTFSLNRAIDKHIFNIAIMCTILSKDLKSRNINCVTISFLKIKRLPMISHSFQNSIIRTDFDQWKIYLL